MQLLSGGSVAVSALAVTCVLIGALSWGSVGAKEAEEPQIVEIGRCGSQNLWPMIRVIGGVSEVKWFKDSLQAYSDGLLDLCDPHSSTSGPYGGGPLRISIAGLESEVRKRWLKELKEAESKHKTMKRGQWDYYDLGRAIELRKANNLRLTNLSSYIDNKSTHWKFCFQ